MSKLIGFERPNATWIWINPKHVIAVRRSSKDKYNTVIITTNSKHVVANQLEDVVNRIDVWLS